MPSSTQITGVRNWLSDCSPTLRQFRYWYGKDNDIFAVSRRRHTARKYDKDMRGLLGSSLDGVSGPGDRYQIDATIGDVTSSAAMIAIGSLGDR